MKVTLAIMLTVFVLLTLVDSKKKNKKNLKTLDPDTTLLRDRTQDPKMVRTKINMIKQFVSSVLDELNVPTVQIEPSLNVSGSHLIACLEVFKDIARGNKQGKDLIQLEKHLKISNLKERLEDDKQTKVAVDLIKTYISDKDLN